MHAPVQSRELAQIPQRAPPTAEERNEKTHFDVFMGTKYRENSV
jgi:hypothetical protein